MRKVERIDPFLKKFGDLWKKCPDLRFGQLFLNICHEQYGDPFFLEEDQFEMLMDKFAKDYLKEKTDEKEASN